MQQQHGQAVSPNSVMYHSPNASAEFQTSDVDQHSNHSHSHHHHLGHHTHQSNHIQNKYTENVNGNDTLTDFVTFVCQEADNTAQSSQVS